MDIRQPEIAPLKSIGELCMIEAEQFEERRVQVVYMNSISNRVESEFVGLADCHAGFDSPTGEPDRKGLVVMIAAEAAIRIGIAFHHRGAAEFAAPNDQGVVEQ